MRKASLLGAALAFTVGPAWGDEVPGPRTATDPVTSSPVPGEPETSTPLLDIVAASAQVSEKDSVVKAVVAPFAFFTDKPFLAETRVEVRTATQSPSKWGATVSVGYSNSAEIISLSRAEQKKLADTCEAKITAAPPGLELRTSVFALADALRAAANVRERVNKLIPAPDGSPSRPEPTDDDIERLKALYREVPSRSKTDAQRLAFGAVIGINNRELLAIGNCFDAAATASMMTNAYSKGYSLRASFGIDMYPFVEGPNLEDEVEEQDPPLETGPTFTTEPIPNNVAGWNVQAAWGVFPIEHMRSWVTLSLARKRAKPEQESMATWVSGSADFAGNLIRRPLAKDGFTPGVAIGLQAVVRICGEDAGCPTALLGYAKEASLRGEYDLVPYLDLRADTKVQFRVSVPIQYFAAARPVEGADPDEKGIWAVAPTLSMTVAAWAL